MIPLTAFLILAAVLFALSLAGILLNQKNVIVILMCMELMLLAVNTNFIAFAHFSHDISGQIVFKQFPRFQFEREGYTTTFAN